MTYAEALAALAGALRFGVNPSLDGIRALTDALGRPQDALRCVQVTGTNGKSSVTRLVAAILGAHGSLQGAYTSPHLESYTERMEVAGRPVSEADFARAIEAATGAADAVGGEYTEFELLTAAALWLFRELGVEWACLEVGMGGRWDATSVVSPAVAVVTGVGLDHTERLGTTIEEIAADKSHVIKPGSVAVLGPGTADVRDILLARSAEADAPAVLVGDDVWFEITRRPDRVGAPLTLDVRGVFARYPSLVLPAPSFQAVNVAVAVAAAEAALGGALELGALRAALAAMRFPGRFEVVRHDPPLVLDGAHNPQAAAVLAAAIREAFGDARPTLVLGILADKDAEGIVAALAPVAARVIVTQADSPRALPTEVLADVVEAATGDRPTVAAPVSRAVAAAGSEPTVVAGSLYTVGEARTYSATH